MSMYDFVLLIYCIIITTSLNLLHNVLFKINKGNYSPLNKKFTCIHYKILFVFLGAKTTLFTTDEL